MKTWKEYYLECKDIYQKITKQDTTSTNIYDLGIMVDPFPTNQTYFDQIFSIQKSLSKIYKNKQNYHIRAGGIALCLNDVFIFEEEIKTILENYLVPYLEKDIFGCYVQCQNVKIYKTTSDSLIEQLSWLWHFDNNPKEQIKVMIYLNDVDDNGPFTYLSKDNKAIKINPTKQDYKNWKPGPSNLFNALGIKWKGTRIPRHFIPKFTRQSCIEKNIKGPTGTTIFFDNNIIHKGTIPFGCNQNSDNFRYAMTLQFQPINKKLQPIFSKENTGNGWNYRVYDIYPEAPINHKETGIPPSQPNL